MNVQGIVKNLVQPKRVLALTALSALAMTSTIQASADEQSQERPHFGIMPMRRASFAPVPFSLPPPPTGCKLKYGGGPVISNVQIVVVGWGNPDAAAMSRAQQYFTAVTNSAYFDWLQEYNTPTQKICRGTYAKTVNITPKTVSGTSIDDSQIGPELVQQIQDGVLPAPTMDKTGHPNTLYVINFGTGYSITAPGGNGQSCVQFCGYHSTTSYNSSYVPYAVIPDNTPASQCASGCGGQANYLDDYGLIWAHEMIEAVTDVGVGDNNLAWYQQGSGQCNGEIGDICANTTGDAVAVNGYVVQWEWSNKQNKCTTTGSGYTPCGACTSNADCSAPTGVCDTATGGCVACMKNTDCSGATPVCNTSTNTCRACGADSDCAAPTPHCDTTSDANKGKCVECTTKAQCPSTKPVCTADACTGCKADADCTGNSAGPTCNTSTGACGPTPSGSSSGSGSGSGSSSSGSSSGSGSSSSGSSSGSGSGSSGSGSGSGSSSSGSGSGSGSSSGGTTADGGVDNSSGGDQFASTSNTGGCAMTGTRDGSPFALGIGVAFAALAIARSKKRGDNKRN